MFVGTWCGHSTRCLSAGAGSSGIAGRVHGCDFFLAGASNYLKLKWTTYWKDGMNGNTNILPMFHDLTTPFYPSITYHKGNCHKYGSPEGCLVVSSFRAIRQCETVWLGGRRYDAALHLHHRRVQDRQCVFGRL